MEQDTKAKAGESVCLVGALTTLARRSMRCVNTFCVTCVRFLGNVVIAQWAELVAVVVEACGPFFSIA